MNYSSPAGNRSAAGSTAIYPLLFCNPEKPLAAFYLFIAIVAEVIATSALKSSHSFTRLGPSLIVISGYSAAFYFLAIALRTIPIGIAYAIWAGAGITIITVIGA